MFSEICDVLLFGISSKVNSNNYVFFNDFGYYSRNETKNIDASDCPCMLIRFSGNVWYSDSFNRLHGLNCGKACYPVN